MQLKEKRALVTGGSKGIGKAIAAALLAKGARVAITGRHEDRLRKTADALGAMALAGDVSREADARATVGAFTDEFGGIDILINNAGIGTFQKLAEIDLEKFERVLAVNVTGAMLVTREAVPHFIRQASGNIVNVSSTAGLKGFAGGSAYAASKFALRGMTDCWRAELRPHNVRVILLNPSEVQTNFGRAAEPSELNPKKLTAEDIAAATVGALEIDDRGFIPEFSVWATNPF